MKNIKDIKKSEGMLNSAEVEELKWVVEEINNVADSKDLNEENLLKLENILTTLINVKRTYTLRVIKLLKQNHILD